MKMSKKMKQAITVAAIAGTVALSGTAFAGTAGWKTQTLGESGSTLYSVAVEAGAGTEGVAVGVGGKIYYTADVTKRDMTASDWSQAVVPVVNDLNAVATTAANNFVAVGKGGTVLLSADSGATWTKAKSLHADMSGEDLVYLATSGTGTLVGTAAGKVFYSANPGAATPVWTVINLTLDGSTSGTALDVAGGLKGFAVNGGSFYAFGAASAVALINTAGGSNTQVAGIADLTRRATGATADEKFGSQTLVAMAADNGGNWYIGTDNGRILNISIAGTTPSTVSTVGGNAQAWTAPTTEVITSISMDLNGGLQHGYFVTTSGSVYRLTIPGTAAAACLWTKASDLTSNQLNAVLADDTGANVARGVAVGASGIMGKGKDIEWKKDAYTAATGYTAFDSTSSQFWVREVTAANAVAKLKRGTSLEALSASISTTNDGIGASDANLSVVGNYVVVPVEKNGAATEDGMAVFNSATGASICEVLGAADAGHQSTPLKAATFVKAGKTYVLLSSNTAVNKGIAAEVSATTPVAIEMITEGPGNTNLNGFGYTANNNVFGSVAASGVYVMAGSSVPTDGSALTFATKASDLAAVSAIHANGGNYVYAVGAGGDADKLYRIPQDASATLDKTTIDVVLPFTFAAGDRIWGTDTDFYALDQTADTIYKLIPESDFGNSRWEVYGSILAAPTDLDAVASIGNRVIAVDANANNELYSTNGTAWAQLDKTLSATAAFNDVYNASGAFYAAGANAMLYKSTDGSKWTLDTDFVAAAPAANLNIVRTSGSNIYTLDNGNKKAYKYDGATWAQYPSTTSTFAANAVELILSAEDKGLMLTAGQVYDFADFSSKGVSGLSNANAMVQLSSSSYLIAANSGKLYTYDGDKTITAVTTDTTKNLTGLYAKSAKEVYIVGASGYFAKYDGATVKQIDTGAVTIVKGKNFTDVWGYGNFVFLTDGTGIYKYDGANFIDDQVQSANINAITGNEKIGGLVAVGNSGTVQYREIGNSGLVTFPGQGDNFVYTSRTSVGTTPDTLNSTYGVDNSTLKLLGDQMSFTANIDAGKTATVGFSFKATANASKTSDIGLIKLIGGAGTALKHFYFNQSAEITTDAGKYYISSTTPESDGTYKALAGDLTVGQDYYVWFNIKDDGNGDLNKTAGKITDPIVATTSGASTPATSSSSSSGCVFNPAAGFGLEWLMLMAAPMIAVVRNRFKK